MSKTYFKVEANCVLSSEDYVIIEEHSNEDTLSIKAVEADAQATVVIDKHSAKLLYTALGLWLGELQTEVRDIDQLKQ